MQDKKISILIVEDDVSLSETLSEIFQDLGCTTATCANGQDAIKKLENGKFSVVITDIKMPKMDGMGMLEMINKKKINVPVVFMTGFADYKEEDIYNQGGVVLLEKPFNREKIKELFVNYISLLASA